MESHLNKQNVDQRPIIYTRVMGDQGEGDGASEPMPLDT